MRVMSWVALVMLTGLGACKWGGPPDGGEPLVLKTYDVPPAYAAELNSVVRSMLRGDKEKPGVGNSAIAVGGRLVVSAPASFHPGIADLVQTLRTRPPGPPPTVSLETWIVVARPAPKPALAGLPPELNDVATEIVKSQGPVELVVLEKLVMTSTSGAHARANGALAEVSATSSVVDDQVLADLDIQPGGPSRFSTRVQVPLGRMVVLGQGGYVPVRDSMPFFENRSQPAGLTMFYVVRARVHGGEGVAP